MAVTMNLQLTEAQKTKVTVAYGMLRNAKDACIRHQQRRIESGAPALNLHTMLAEGHSALPRAVRDVRRRVVPTSAWHEWATDGLRIGRGIGSNNGESIKMYASCLPNRDLVEHRHGRAYVRFTNLGDFEITDYTELPELPYSAALSTDGVDAYTVTFYFREEQSGEPYTEPEDDGAEPDETPDSSPSSSIREAQHSLAVLTTFELMAGEILEMTDVPPDVRDAVEYAVLAVREWE